MSESEGETNVKTPNENQGMHKKKYRRSRETRYALWYGIKVYVCNWDTMIGRHTAATGILVTCDPQTLSELSSIF